MEIGPRKLVELEAVRGIAALIVFVHHFMLGFAPRTHGLLFPQEQASLFGTPLFAFVNGTASVVLFFVLSGFVLTYRAIGSGRAGPLVSGAIKRWPRLTLLVVTVNIVSGVLFAAGLYRNLAASPVTGSPWLGWFFAKSPYSMPPPIAAAYEGGFATFFYGANFFNSSLWTMYFEFFGSFLAFGFAYLCIVLRPLGLLLATMAIIPLAVYFSPYFLCFIGGVLLAKAYSSRPAWERLTYAVNESRSKPFWLTLCVALIVALFGYHEPLSGSLEPVGFYKFMAPIAALDPATTRVVLHTLAAALILTLALTHRASRAWLGGRLGALLGKLSFPVYLTHFVVICSVGSWLYLLLLPYLSLGLLLAVTFLCTAGVTVAASFPLANLDRWWLQSLRRWEQVAELDSARWQGTSNHRSIRLKNPEPRS